MHRYRRPYSCCTGYAYRRRKKQANVLPYVICAAIVLILFFIMPSWLIYGIIGAAAGAIFGLLFGSRR